MYYTSSIEVKVQTQIFHSFLLLLQFLSISVLLQKQMLHFKI